MLLLNRKLNMKPAYVYATFIVLSVGLIAYLLNKPTPKTELKLLDRSANISNASEWLNTKAAIEKLLGDLRNNPDNPKLKKQLALAYIQESRVTGNHSYYDKAAMQLIDEILKQDANDYEALCAQATVLLSQHHFADALLIGHKVVKQNAYSAYGYGILTDSNVELGNYEEAIKSADKMVSVRPDMRSYSRVSYLREIFGDTNGAIEAMQMAVDAGLPGAEQTEWARVYVGHLYEMTGDMNKASEFYQLSLYHRPQYAYALAGMGRVAKARRNYKEAMQYFSEAKFNVPDYSFYDELGEVNSSMLKPNDARTAWNEAIDMLSVGNGKEGDKGHGHYSDRELALLYLKTYQYDLALQHALTEYSRRPLNVDVNQTLAWVRYRRGEYMDANEKIDIALKTHSQNPLLLFQAGLIKAKAIGLSQGKVFIQQSLAISKNISPELEYEAKQLMGDSVLMALK